MDDQQYKLWVKNLFELSNEQRTDVTNRLKLLSFVVTKEFTGKQDFGVRVSEAICKVMSRAGTECPSPSTIRKSAAYAGARAKFDDLAAFFDKVSKQRLVQDAALSIAIELLYDDLVAWGIPVSSHTLLAQCHRIPSTLNRAFPGYAQMGILAKLIKT